MFKTVLRVVISVGLLGLIAWQTDWPQVQHAFTHLRLEFWLGAVAVLAMAQLVSALRWQYLAQRLGLHRPIGHMVGFYFIGMYFNLVLPTSVGGDVVRAWYLDGNSGHRLKSFVSTFLDRLCGLWVLLILGFLGVVCSPLAFPDWIRWTVFACVGGGVVGMASLPVLCRHRHNMPTKLRKLLEAILALPSWRVLVVPVALSVIVQVANVLMVWLVGLSLGAEVPGAFYWILVPMVSLLMMMPVSVNGMGVREGGGALMEAPFGVSQGSALTLAFLWFAVTVTVSLMGGLVYLFGRFPRPEVEPPRSPVVGTEPNQDAEKTSSEEAKHGCFSSDPDQGRTRQYPAAA
ncbi:MAG: lysylphosphatidylglycerol synthase transmembrane domain-containing protein [Gemmataceae bacterium]